MTLLICVYVNYVSGLQYTTNINNRKRDLNMCRINSSKCNSRAYVRMHNVLCYVKYCSVRDIYIYTYVLAVQIKSSDYLITDTKLLLKHY